MPGEEESSLDRTLARIREQIARGETPTGRAGAAPAERTVTDQTLRNVGHFGAGANRVITGTLGAPLDAYDWLLKQAGIDPLFGRAAPPPTLSGLVTGERPQGQTATERIRAGFDSVLGRAPEPGNTQERVARGAGGGAAEALAMAIPAAGVSRVLQAGRAVMPAEAAQQIIALGGRAPGGVAGDIAAQVAARGGSAPVRAAPGSLPNVLGTGATQAQPGLVGSVATTLAAQPATQALAGGVGGGVAEGTGSPLAGVAASLATPLGVAGARRVLTPAGTINPERQRLIDLMGREGIPVTAGQATGNPWLRGIESAMEQLPLTSGPARARNIAAEEAFTRAATRHAGSETPTVTPDVLNDLRNRIGQRIETIANRNRLEWTPEFDADVRAMRDALRFLPEEVAAPIARRIDELHDVVRLPPPGSNRQTNAYIDGATYRRIDSQLGRAARATDNGDRRTALSDLREMLRRHMDDSISRNGSPEDVADWAEARRQYANLMVIAQTMRGAGNTVVEGRIPPMRLHQAVDNSTGGGYAFGRGDMNDLARIGQSMLRPVPDSGTAQRAMAQTMLTGGTLGTSMAAGADPVVTAGLGAASLALPRVAQAVMNTGPVQRYLRNQVMPTPAGSVYPGVAATQAGAPTDDGSARRASLTRAAAFLSPQQRAMLGL